MVICLSPGGQTTTFVDRATDTLFVGTIDGIYSFGRTNGSWSRRDHFLPGEHISALLCEPQSGTVFAGTHKGALHASKDWGKTWESKNSGVREPNIFTLNAQRRGERPRIYLGTEPAHLYFSDDLGNSWTELPALRSVPSVDQWTFPAPPHIGHVKTIAFDHKRSEVLYVGIEVGGLLKSTDGGSTWKEIGNLYVDVHRILVLPSNPEKVYVVTPSYSEQALPGLKGICLSEDGGGTWNSLTPKDFRLGYPDALVMHPKVESLMFTSGARTTPGTWRNTRTADPRIARSRDGGRTWQVVDRGLPEHIRGNIEALALNAWNGGFSVFAGTTDGEVFCSDDEGENWRKVVEGIPPVSKVGHFRNLRDAA